MSKWRLSRAENRAFQSITQRDEFHDEMMMSDEEADLLHSSHLLGGSVDHEFLQPDMSDDELNELNHEVTDEPVHEPRHPCVFRIEDDVMHV